MIFNPRERTDLTSQEVVQLVRYTDTVNDIRLDGQLSPSGRVSPSADLNQAGRAARDSERARAAEAGTPYEGAVGHAADATWTGRPVPREWHDQTTRINGSLGGTASSYPPGYKPTIFRALLPDGTLHPPRTEG